MSKENTWKSLDNIGKSGSENGIILKDEEYNKASRITLEKCEKYYAITCGIYGEMVHTAFCDEDNFEEKYEAMKAELKAYFDSNYSIPDFCETFVKKF